MNALPLVHSLRTPDSNWRRLLNAFALGAVLAVSSERAAQAQVTNAFCFGDGVAPSPNCPCGPAQNGALGVEGCKNSSGIFGAFMTATGNACVTAGCGLDTLSLSGIQLPPPGTVLTILLQSQTAFAVPVFLDDGLRCFQGGIKRLYRLNGSTAGTVKYPPSGAPSISAMSALLGDTLAAGSVRYYQIWYRDPPPAWCPVGTSNLSSGMIVTWR